MNSGRGPLTGAELAAVTEGLKVLLLLANKTAAQGEAAQVRQGCGGLLVHGIVQFPTWCLPDCLLAGLLRAGSCTGGSHLYVCLDA